MFTEVIKILDSLVKILHNMSSVEKNNFKKLGNQLLNIFLIVDNIVEQGKLLFNIIRKDKILPITFGITILVSIQESVKSLFDNVKHESFEKNYKLRVPELKKIEGIINTKSNHLSFNILQLIKTAQQIDIEVDKLSTSTKNHTDMNHLVLAQPDEIVDINENRKNLFNRNLSLLVISGTKSQLEQAEKLLEDIIRLSAELRALIINEFDFDDIF